MESYQEQVLAFLKGELGDEEKKAFEETLARSSELRAELERSRELLDVLEAASEQATVHRVDHQIQEAIRRGASDIHVIPGSREAIVSLRIDGRLHEFERIPKDLYQAVVDRWKVLTDCRVTERQLPQEGRILTAQDDKEFDLRVMVMPTLFGERVTARVMLKSNDVIRFDRLYFSEAQIQALRRLTRRPSGLIVATGPVYSGKTLTLYNMLLDLHEDPDRERANIMTVEEPVEFVLEGISQTRVNRHIGLTFAAALRAVLHSDLDVAVVGDLPDQETAELALQMAATGHLVLTQLTASSALGAVPRLREIGVDPFLIAQTLIGAVSQRLLRRICKECVSEYEPPSLLLQRFGLTPADGPFHRGTGCEVCRKSGYKGRLAVYEILEVTDELRQLIANDTPREILEQETFGQTGGSLWDDARDKIRQGLTTVEEAARVLFDYPRLPPKGEAE
jgi:type II secretory ATPase GspE/PulE/Tfp pilus assembly ATPase PilB-like protein